MDRDGREFFAAVALAIKIAGYVKSAYDVYEGYKTGGLQGAVNSAVISLAFSGAPANTTGPISYMTGEMFRSSLSSSFAAMANGGNVGNAMAYGAASGLISSGVNTLAYMEANNWKWIDPRKLSPSQRRGMPAPGPDDPPDKRAKEQHYILSGSFNAGGAFGPGYNTQLSASVDLTAMFDNPSNYLESIAFSAKDGYSYGTGGGFDLSLGLSQGELHSGQEYFSHATDASGSINIRSDKFQIGGEYNNGRINGFSAGIGLGKGFIINTTNHSSSSTLGDFLNTILPPTFFDPKNWIPNIQLR